MNGYLVRLALRAMGLSQGLSPRMASRFEEAIEETAASPEVTPPHARFDPIDRSDPPDSSDQTARTAKPDPMVERPLAPHRRDAPWGVSPRPAPIPQVLPAQQEPQIPQAPQRLQIPHARQVSQNPQVLPPPQPRRSAVENRSSSSASETPHGASLQRKRGSTEVEAGGRSQSSLRRTTAEIVLQPPARVRHDSPQHLPPRRESHSEPEPVIRVSIGRIEVKAVHPAPAPSATPAYPTASVPRSSLDDYLTRRRQGS
jgi:hypothetical protein